MYFDFEDYRPETPRVSRAISVREGILLSIIVHLVFLVFLLVFPDFLSPSDEATDTALLEPLQQRPPLTFVEAVPLRDIPKPPEREAPMSDLDRRAAAPDPEPVASEPQPAMRGNTPEMVEGGPSAPPQPAEPTPPSPPGEATSVLADAGIGRPAPPQQTQPDGSQSRVRMPSDMFRDVGRYTRPDRFDNPQGGATDQSADIQFDSMGVDFGSWLRRFKNQVERNWLIPPAAMVTRGRVVIRFVVLKNGTLIELQVVQPAAEPSLTSAALNALKLSNPTAQLPSEYPADRMPITVTFYYNEDPREGTVNPLVAIVGPTATGKSALGIDIARHFNGEIVACDSTAVYRGLDIGTDKVPVDAQGGVRHHLVDMVDIAAVYSAADYARDAASAIRAIAGRGHLPILVGGTGFYFRALTRGLFPGPSRQDALRARLDRVASRRGVESLWRWLRVVDPPSAARIMPRDQKRLVRALEVYLVTRKTLSAHFAETASPVAEFQVLTIALNMDREALRARVARRVDQQLAAGVVEEVRRHLAAGVAATAHAFSGLVYRQVVGHLAGMRDLAATRDLIVQENMRYARRQRLWFQKEPGVHWIPGPGEQSAARSRAIGLVDDFVNGRTLAVETVDRCAVPGER